MGAVEPLKVDTTELRMTAGQIEGQGAEFGEAHQAAHSQAGGTSLGSGAAAAALPGMLAEWEKNGEKFKGHFIRFADGHRDAAAGYDTTDAAGGDEIGRASSGL
ncbi:MAG: type VII secretion target [Mycobacterium sp.]